MEKQNLKNKTWIKYALCGVYNPYFIIRISFHNSNTLEVSSTAVALRFVVSQAFAPNQSNPNLLHFVNIDHCWQPPKLLLEFAALQQSRHRSSNNNNNNAIKMKSISLKIRNDSLSPHQSTSNHNNTPPPTVQNFDQSFRNGSWSKGPRRA